MLEEHKRLMGEVGYYRMWSSTGERPSIDVKSDEDTFKAAGSAEIIFYPAGVQDLYYLNNEELGLEKEKKYIIDVQNSMIYSLEGGKINGVQVHSLAMARMIQNGALDVPKFAELETEGVGGGVYAGSKWLTDKDGNYIDENGNKVDEEHKVENPYGFEIIADSRNQNVYKLYNNGELYGKGVKGPLLNTAATEMEQLNSFKWTNLKIPSEIPGSEDRTKLKVVMGTETIYVVDKNKELWAWGDNSFNKLGLSDRELQEYTGREAVKLNLTNLKDNSESSENVTVEKVFCTRYQTFVLAKIGNRYQLGASGFNTGGCLGVGFLSTNTQQFEKIDFSNPQNIVNIFNDESSGVSIVVVNNR